jgi:hypothetical protein
MNQITASASTTLTPIGKDDLDRVAAGRTASTMYMSAPAPAVPSDPGGNGHMLLSAR